MCGWQPLGGRGVQQPPPPAWAALFLCDLGGCPLLGLSPLGQGSEKVLVPALECSCSSVSGALSIPSPWRHSLKSFKLQLVRPARSPARPKSEPILLLGSASCPEAPARSVLSPSPKHGARVAMALVRGRRPPRGARQVQRASTSDGRSWRSGGLCREDSEAELSKDGRRPAPQQVWG